MSGVLPGPRGPKRGMPKTLARRPKAEKHAMLLRMHPVLFKVADRVGAGNITRGVRIALRMAAIAYASQDPVLADIAPLLMGGADDCNVKEEG